MVQDLETTLKDVKYMVAELQEAEGHLERALYTRNRLRKAFVSSEKLVQEMVKHYNPPTEGMERR